MEYKNIYKKCCKCRKETEHEGEEAYVMEKSLSKDDWEYSPSELASYMKGEFYDDYEEVLRLFDTCCVCGDKSYG
ncbi:hypothetical protein ACH66W_00375, partial [Klebsiella pneumoniae]